MKKVLMFVMALTVLSCSHVNNLEHYDLSGEAVYFEEVVLAHSAQVSMSNDNNVKTKKGDNNRLFRMDLIRTRNSSCSGRSLCSNERKRNRSIRLYRTTIQIQIIKEK